MYIEHFLEATLAIQIHMIAAIGAFVLGMAVLWHRKGGAAHRINGRIWVLLMIITALSGFFIHEIRLWGDFSPIHLISVFVPFSLGYAIYAARKRNITVHQRVMRGTFIGGMVIAGGFTFLPGRLSYRLLFGEGGVSIEPVNLGWMFAILVAFAAAVWVVRRSTAR